MDRKVFLKQLGLSGSALFAVYCMGLEGCANNSPTPTPASSVDFTLDLTAAENNALNTKGGYVITQQIVVAYTTTGEYVAVTQICSHEGQVQVVYQKSSNNFYCNVHGATYNTSGAGTNSTGSKGIKAYKTALTGTSLRIYS